MTLRNASSGDVLIDRRFAYAQALLAAGDTAAAADLLTQIVERAPLWVPAWMALGLSREREGDRTAAAAAYAEAAACDGEGVYGASLHHARLRDDDGVPAMPPRYVAALFDDYAPRFETHLVETLAYRGPDLLLAALIADGLPDRVARVVDLGCGTGLMGRVLRRHADHLDGVDLSPRMIEEARRTGLYDDLAVGGIEDRLDAMPGGSVDLVVAADVLVYLGPLDRVFRGASRALRPQGRLAFTVQSGEGAIRLGADLRFAHSAAYLARALLQAGFAPPSIAAASTRKDGGIDVPGLVVVARTPESDIRFGGCAPA